MIRETSERTKVYVVDARPSDYQELALDSSADIQFTFFSNGRHALRANPEDADLWIVNLELPDMDGVDLLSMLRSRRCGASIALVSDAYSEEREITARSAGAHLFFVKPMATEMLMMTV